MKILTLVAALALTGCASTDYAQYAGIHVKRAETEALRYDALANVARHSNDQATRVAAVVALAVAGGNNAASVAAPEDPALKLAGKVIDAGVSLYSIRSGAAIKLGDMSRGAADTDVLKEGLGTLDVYRTK